MSSIRELRNIGDTVARRLEEIGIQTREDLRAAGAARTYRNLQLNHPDAHLPVCYYLYSLEGALSNRDWRSIPERQKRALREEAGLCS